MIAISMFLVGAVVLTAFGAMAVLAVAIHFDNKRRNSHEHEQS